MDHVWCSCTHFGAWGFNGSIDLIRELLNLTNYQPMLLGYTLADQVDNQGVIHLLALGYNDSVQDSLDADANSEAEYQEPEPDRDE